MSVFEVRSGGDRRSLVKRFMGKNKQDAVSQLVDMHLAHCVRAEHIEELLKEILNEVPYRWGQSFRDSDLAEKIRFFLPEEEE